MNIRLFLVFLFSCFLVTAAYASVTLRVVAVNPSEDSNQTVPIKVYLPVEIKPEDVIYREDLDIAYDTQQGSYYVFGDYELKPKEVLEKEIELKDIWVIEETHLAAWRKEADEILTAFKNTPYNQKAELLYKSIDRKLKEIEDIQAIPKPNPTQHISDYRYCLTLTVSVKSELASAKTLLSEVSPQEKVQLSWKIILFIIGFLGVLSLGFYIIWQRQAKVEE